jgi:hypothetical protein
MKIGKNAISPCKAPIEEAFVAHAEKERTRP